MKWIVKKGKNIILSIGAIGFTQFSVRGYQFQLYDFFVQFRKPFFLNKWNDAECVSALWDFGAWEACR